MRHTIPSKAVVLLDLLSATLRLDQTLFRGDCAQKQAAGLQQTLKRLHSGGKSHQTASRQLTQWHSHFPHIMSPSSTETQCGRLPSFSDHLSQTNKSTGELQKPKASQHSHTKAISTERRSQRCQVADPGKLLKTISQDLGAPKHRLEVVGPNNNKFSGLGSNWEITGEKRGRVCRQDDAKVNKSVH